MKKHAMLKWSSGGALPLGLLLTQTIFAQTNLFFTSVLQTDEQAIRLEWASTNSEVYQIQCADALAGNDDGSTDWQIFYDDYPSQGTNTFWLDTGNYHLAPSILRPKDRPMRLYRILDKGADNTSSEPQVSIIALTNNTIVFGELAITVLASTDQPELRGTKLYVDGQEMQTADNQTNYTDGATKYEQDIYKINTCEWGNGTHRLFATAKCASDYGGPINGSSPILTGHGVSAFVDVNFNNLETRISFSEPFFDPASYQTQQVSAVFAANANWALQIRDVNSNLVQTASGSGISMQYNWNGTGTGGTNLPAGIYYYYVTAQTNGQSFVAGIANKTASVTPLDSASLSQNSLQVWALPPESKEAPLPLALFPPGFDTNGFIIFEATPMEVQSLVKEVAAASNPKIPSKEASAKISGVNSASNSGNATSPVPSPQPTPPAPKRPPTSPVRGIVGTYGVGYQTYDGGVSLLAPPNGLPLGGRVKIQGSSGSIPFRVLDDVSIQEFIEEFIGQMKRGAWQSGFVKANSQLTASDLQGASSVFNVSNVSLGLLALHSGYGTTADFTASGCQQIYFAIDGRPGGSSWVRASELSFGSAGTNGLKWMALMACNSLRQNNWNSMQNVGVTPFNGNLHLLLGANSNVDDGNLNIWAKKLLGLDGQPYDTIYNAWQNSASFCAHLPVRFAIAGYDDCKGDMLTGDNSNTPQGDIFYDALPAAQ